MRRLRLLLACLILSLAFVPPALTSQLDTAQRALVVVSNTEAAPPQSQRAAANSQSYGTARRAARSARPWGLATWVSALSVPGRSSHEPSFDGQRLYLEQRALLC